MLSNKTYFPGLNGVRFFAAFLVLLDHLELFKGYFGLRTLWGNEYSAHLGSLGVTVFFVLSGFLITYLLIEEKKIAEINIAKFYARRVLRIWPLYYLIILISFFIVPKLRIFDIPIYNQSFDNFFSTALFLYSFFLTNIAFVFLPTVAFANILWSVAVEEQFYLIWPVIIKYFKKTSTALTAIFLLYVSIKILFALNVLGLNKYWSSGLNILIDRTRISSMVIGGVGALLLVNKRLLCKWIFPTFTQILAIIALTVILLGLITNNSFYLFIKNELFSIITIVLILNISSNKYTILDTENRFLNYLGKISYGIYLFHMFCAVICLKLFIHFRLVQLLPYYVWSAMLIASVCLMSILISHISYSYFEKPFLKMKAKFA